MNLQELETGDVFSEIAHYTFLGKKKDEYEFLHEGSQQKVLLTGAYVKDLLTTADHYEKEVKVGKEDKKDGTAGIRTIWEEIYDQQVFTVCFKKQDVELSSKKLKELQQQQINDIYAKIEKAQKSKKGVADEAKRVLEEMQKNPILPYIEGEERILRGYKIQFSSRDGRYNCVDMDIDDLKANVRPVNINSILWLVYKNTKYIVEK